MNTNNFYNDGQINPQPITDRLGQFLENFEGCSIQTFDDAKLERPLAKTFGYDAEAINKLQSEGAGIFCSINPTKSIERTIDNLSHISGVMLDLDVCKEKDGKNQEEIGLLKSELMEKLKGGVLQPPHFIIDTKNGLQPIWLFEAYQDYASAEEANKKYRSLVDGLGRAIGVSSEGDNVVRVFRCPYTKHLKTPNYPYDVQLIEDSPTLPRYKFEEFLKQYGEVSKVKCVTHKYEQVFEERTIEDVIKAAAIEAGITIDFKEQANGTKTIIENGEETSGFVDQTGTFCASMSGKKRKGREVEVVCYYLKCERKEAKEWLKENFDMDFKFNAAKVARDIQGEYDLAQVGRAYFSCEEGVWKKIAEEDINNIIIRTAEQKSTFHNRNRINETRKYLDDFSYDTHGKSLEAALCAPRKNRHEIVFKNCILDVQTWKKRDASKKDYIITKLPLEYKEDDPNCPKFIKFLEEIFVSDTDHERKVEFVQEWMGYSMIADATHERALILLGQGSNGKSVLLHIWANMIGEHNCAAIDLPDIANPQFVMQLMGKLINISTEIRSEHQLDTGAFKKLVSGEEITGKSIYERPLKFTNAARLIFAANTLPYLKDGGESVKRRLHILRFNTCFTEANKNRNLKHELLAELNDIGMWALAGLKRLRSRGYFDPPASVTEAVDEYLTQSDTVNLFMQRKYDVTKDPDHRVQKSAFYEAYKDFCKTDGYKALSNRKVYERLRILGVATNMKSVGVEYLQGIREVGGEVEQQCLKYEQTPEF